jgi:erythronate-4-phosphate dehydrogenase
LIYQAICRFLGLEASWNSNNIMPKPEIPFLNVHLSSDCDENILNRIIQQIYNIESDDSAFREILTVPKGKRGDFFNQLRKNYPERREFFNTELEFSKKTKRLETKLAILGFKIAHDS